MAAPPVVTPAVPPAPLENVNNINITDNYNPTDPENYLKKVKFSGKVLCEIQFKLELHSIGTVELYYGFKCLYLFFFTETATCGTLYVFFVFLSRCMFFFNSV